MIGFNTLLRDEEIDPVVVKLARHQKAEPKARLTPYDLWLADDGQLELYQRIQREDHFAEARTGGECDN